VPRDPRRAVHVQPGCPALTLSLCARVQIRLCNREIRGEDNDNLSVVRVDKELTSLEGVLRRDVGGLNAAFSEAELIESVKHAIEAMRTFRLLHAVLVVGAGGGRWWC